MEHGSDAGTNQRQVSGPDALLHREVTEQIIGAAFEVHRVLGYGFVERVYQRAMQTELQLRGVAAVIEHGIPV